MSNWMQHQKATKRLAWGWLTELQTCPQGHMSVHTQQHSPNSHTSENPKHCHKIWSKQRKSGDLSLPSHWSSTSHSNCPISLLHEQHTSPASSETTVTLSFIIQITNISNRKLHIKSRATQHPVKKRNHHRSSDYSLSHHKKFRSFTVRASWAYLHVRCQCLIGVFQTVPILSA